MSMKMRQVGSLPARSAIFIEGSKDIGYAIDMLMLHSIRHLLVVDENVELVGVLSAMDILRSLYSNGSEDFLQIPAQELATKDVFTVNADETIKDAVLLMENLGFSGLPVTTDGKIVGYFTQKDVISLSLDELWEEIPDVHVSTDDNNIGRLIKHEHTVTDDYTIWQVADRFIQSNRRQLVTTDGESGKYKGLITPSKLFTTLIPSFERKFQEGILQNTPIRTFNIDYITFTSISTSLLHLRKEMATHSLDAIPIVSTQKVTKLIGEKDLLGYLSLHI